MSFNLTLTAKALARQISISPNLIMEIEGVDLIFGISPILEAARWDNGINWDDPNVRWDGLVGKPESREYLSFKKTTKDLKQQVLIDKGGSSSASTMNFQIVNKNAEISRALSFDNIMDILGRRCNVYLNFSEGSHPEDSIPIFRGYIDDYGDDSTSIILSVSHSENLKRKSFLEKWTSNLTQAVKYKEITVQDIFFDQKDKFSPVLSIEYVSGSSGPTTASIAGSIITVSLSTESNPASPNYPTAERVVTAVRSSPNVNFFVDAEVSGTATNPQVIQPLTQFEISTVISVASTVGLFSSQDAITSYIQINDEIMQVLSIDSPTQVTVNRSELGSFPTSHEQDSDTASVYEMTGNPIDLALKIMLSEEDNEYYDSSETIESFRFVDSETNIPGAIIFSNIDIQDSTGLVEGDLFKIVGSDNNDGDYIADSFSRLDDGRSIIIVKDNALVTETTSSPQFSYLSKYGLLSTGLGMQPNEVDVAGFEEVFNLYSSSFIDYTFYIKETISDAKDFIDKQLFFSQGLYSIPRKARSSVKFTAPPLSIEDTPVLNTSTVKNMADLQQKRSTRRYFYNTVTFDYNKNVFDGEFKSRSVTIDNDSLNRIKTGASTFKIKSDGLRRSTATELVISRLTQRILDRYKFAARYFDDVRVLYGVGYSIEIGDVVLFGGEDTKLINLETGERDFPLAKYEVINKKMSIESGNVSLTLLETGFSVDGRYGVVSPTSYVAAGSNSTILKLDKFLDIGEYSFEGEKWSQWIGSKIVIHNEDWSECEEATILEIPNSNLESMVISELQTIVLSEGMLIELADYDSQPINESGDKVKLKYVFEMHSSQVLTSIDNISFEADITNLSEGQLIQVHNEDYSEDSEIVEIASIIGNTVTLSENINYTPQVGDKIETYSIPSDNGDGYRYA